MARLDIVQAKIKLQQLFNNGIRSVAIVFMHSYRFPKHEKQVGEKTSRAEIDLAEIVYLTNECLVP